jgi:hypothetical protein
MENTDAGSIDITGLNFHQLEELRTRAEKRVTEMRESGAPALREQSGEQPAAIGMTIEEIMESGKLKGRRARGRNGHAE